MTQNPNVGGHRRRAGRPLDPEPRVRQARFSWPRSSRPGNSWPRITNVGITLAVVCALTLVGAVTPAEASTGQRARSLAAATLAEVTAAASGSNTDDGDSASAPADEQLASATLRPGDGTTLTADAVDASVTFGGKKIDAPLNVSVSRMPDGTATSAASETAGIVMSAPVKITAVDASGNHVTQVDAEVQASTTQAGDSVPGADTNGTVAGGTTHSSTNSVPRSGRPDTIDSDTPGSGTADSGTADPHTGSPETSGPTGVIGVKPGVSLSLGVDPSKLPGIDPKTLQIYTRESPGDPWLPLASHYDKATRTVYGESGHLSQFVVIGKPYVAPVGPVVVLDPDDGVAHTDSPAKIESELPYNIALANGVKALLQNACLATVTLTRSDPGTPYVSAQTRADFAAAQNPALTATLAFDAPVGHAWGVTGTSGGSKVFSNGVADSDAVSDDLNNTLPTYTTRPSKSWAPIPAQNIPQKEFATNPGTYVHLEALNLDNNYDWPIIDQHLDQVAAGVAESFRQYLISKGYNCLSPAAAGFPSPPTAAQKAAWADLGRQNYELYGSEPVSFSTGNLIESEPLFTLPGNGGSGIDLALTYNSQDGRLSRIGAGWSFGVGAHAQVFDDGSVMIVRGDGASYTFTPNGAGGYTGDPSKHQTLANAAGRLTLTGADGQTWVFDASDPEGIGELASYRDAAGNGYDLQYGPPSANAQFTPISSITDTGGQIIRTGSDDAGRVTTVAAPDGRVWTFGYDTDGNLTGTGYPGNSGTRSFSYDGAHQLLTATDPTGVTYLRNEYDAHGRVLKQHDAQNNTRTFTYDAGKTTYTDNEGNRSVFVFDDRHRITAVTNAQGGTKSYTYDTQNNVTVFTDESGHRYGYTYDANGHVTKILAPDGTATKYTYSPTGQVASVTDQGGANGAARTTTYDIDSAGSVTGVHLPDGSHVANTFDAAGNLATSTAPGGQRTTYSYDAHGHLTGTTDPNGHTTAYAYNAAGLLTSSTDANGAASTYRYDGAGNLAAVTDPAGGVTAYTYDGNAHLLSSTDPAGAVTTYSWDALFRLATVTAPDGGTTTYTYNTEDALTQTTNPTGAKTTFTLDKLYRATTVTDPNGGAWQRTYDPLGHVTQTTNPAGAVTTHEFDTLGRLTSSTDPQGNTNTTAHDQAGRVTTTTDPAGNTTTYTYDILGRTSTLTNPAGDKTTYTYDRNGNVTTVTDPAGRRTSFTYDPAGNVLTATDPTGAKVSYGYDAANQLTSATDAFGRTSTATYDPRGLVTTATNPAGNSTTYSYDTDGRGTAVTDPNGHTRTRTYTPTGQIASSADALGDTTHYGYNTAGQQTSTTDPLGAVTHYSYDPAGQLTSVIENATTDRVRTSSQNVTTSYRYDNVGNLTGLTDPNGHTSTYTYDANSRLTAETNPVGNTHGYTYDNLGELTAQTDANGRTTGNSYDSLGHLQKTTYADGSSTTFAYDKAGQPIAMTDSLGVTGWKYDPAGRVTEQIDPAGRRVGYTYDTTGALTDLTLPTGDTIGYTYDKAGRPVTQSSPWGSLTYAWDAAGNLATETRSTGVTTTFGYDPADRVTTIGNQLPTPAAPAPAPATSTGSTATPGGSSSLPASDYLSHRTTPTPPNPVADGGTVSFAYTYDKNSDVTSATRTIGAGTSSTATPAQQSSTTKTYTYDPLGRLTGNTSTDGSRAAYGYDPAGNRTTKAITDTAGRTSATTAAYNKANQLTDTSGATTSSYGYDNNGQRTSSTVNGATTNYTWSDAGRMTGATRDGRTTSYAYDGLGRQQTTTETTPLGSQTTTNVWSGTNIVQQSNPASGTTSQIRDALGGVALQASDLNTADTGTRWNLLDRLGTVAAQAVGGSVTQLADYDDFGTQSFETTGWNAVAGFGSQQTDPTTGLNSYYSRQYDPSTGTWLTPDAERGLLTDPQSLNRYAYVTNNPITMADQLGFRPYNPTGVGVQHYGGGNYSSSGYPSYAPAHTAVVPTYTPATPNSSKPGYGTGTWLKPTTSDGYGWEPIADEKLLQLRHVEGSRITLSALSKYSSDTANSLAYSCIIRGQIFDCAASIDHAHISNIAQSDQGKIILGWALGLSAQTTLYGPGSGLVRSIQDQAETQAARQLARECLASSGHSEPVQAVYKAENGLESIPNVVRDACTYVFWESSWVCQDFGVTICVLVSCVRR
ncbi:hypothetical protein BH09ACT6_BH09ACT6_26000 [soil metagenome]